MNSKDEDSDWFWAICANDGRVIYDSLGRAYIFSQRHVARWYRDNHCQDGRVEKVEVQSYQTEATS